MSDVYIQVVILVPERRGSNFFWLAGSDIGQEDDYVWMTTGQPMNYTAWYSSAEEQEPSHIGDNGLKENCVTIRNIKGFKWNDAVCSSNEYYICDNQL